MGENNTHTPLTADRDRAALEHLTNIRLIFPKTTGFQLVFEFSENEYFSNKELIRTYRYQDDDGLGGSFIYDHAEGTSNAIEWKEGKEPTVRVVSKMRPSNGSYHISQLLD